MDTRNDTELIKDYTNGDTKAFDVLVSRYARPIYAFVYRLVGNSVDVEDVVQEIFIKAWKNIRKFDSERNVQFKSWIFAIARNTAIDWLRKKRPVIFSTINDDKNSVSDGESNEKFENNIPDTAPLAHELFEREETANALDEILSSLHPDDKTIIILHHYETLTFEEIAEITKKPMNTVKSRYRRSMAKLRKLVAPK
jgi:RNA polymerase sigma-70 factor (ECF subfamily)